MPSFRIVFGLILIATAGTSNARCQQAGSASAVADYFNHWIDRVQIAQSSQPNWIPPVVTATPRLEQAFRYDQNRQTLNNGSTVDIYGGGKGFEFIPTEQTDVTITLPAYQVRRGISPATGFADWPGIVLKVRALSANEQSGNYIVTLYAQYGLPSGALPFTSRNHVVTPTIGGGKGFGDFDFQATIGESIPTRDRSNAGRALSANVAFQYHISKLLWPELELNRTDWYGGAKNTRSQTYLTPGLVVGRFVLKGRLKLVGAVGYQTPISRRYDASPATPSFNHNWICSTRVLF